MGEFVRLETADCAEGSAGVATIRIDKPPVNALNRQLQDELRDAADEASRSTEIRAVIVYGGQKTFAGGADIKEMADMPYQRMSSLAHRLSSAITTIAEIPKPTVAAVTGYALGGGLEVALACDRRIVGDNVKVGQPEIALGIIPGMGGTQRLTRLVGPSRAKDLIYTGRFVTAQEALAIGLVDEVVAPDDVYEAAKKWAGQFTNGPALALAAAKRAIDGGLDMDLDNGLKLESTLFAGLFATEDRATGMRSFIENGPGKAVFEGN